MRTQECLPTDARHIRIQDGLQQFLCRLKIPSGNLSYHPVATISCSLKSHSTYFDSTPEGQYFQFLAEAAYGLLQGNTAQAETLY